MSACFGASSVLQMDATTAAGAIGSFWEQVEATTADRRWLVSYLQALLTGKDQTMTTYEIDVRALPERKILTISRHVTIEGTGAFFHDAFSRLRGAAPGIEGIAGVPFLVFYGEVSDDSDGPIELCRPVAPETTEEAVEASPDVQLRVEPAHDEAYIRLALKDLSWPAMLPACDSLARWASEHQRQPAGALRQVLIADRRGATPETLVCDLTIPLR